jgi:hypothetical protein
LFTPKDVLEIIGVFLDNEYDEETEEFLLARVVPSSTPFVRLNVGDQEFIITVTESEVQ